MQVFCIFDNSRGPKRQDHESHNDRNFDDALNGLLLDFEGLTGKSNP